MPEPRRLKVSHYQIECEPGDVDANIAKVMLGLEHAQAERVDVQTFPESFLTGYFTDPAKARRHSFAIDGPEVTRLLEATAHFDATWMVGFNEQRGEALYNTVFVAHRGKLLGTYSKAFPCFDYFTPGRDFPIFERNGVKFGVVICADGGYIEPTRILAMKGAQVVFAPHYNYVSPEGVLRHSTMVLHDHIARAVENGVWFMRCNSVGTKRDAGLDRDGLGYGDSYLLDPMGTLMARSTRSRECFVTHTIELDGTLPFGMPTRSIDSHAALADVLAKAAAQRQT